MKQTVQINLQLSPAELEAFDFANAGSGKSRSAAIRELMAAHVANQQPTRKEFDLMSELANDNAAMQKYIKKEYGIAALLKMQAAGKPQDDEA
jgi:hypothetical protein